MGVVVEGIITDVQRYSIHDGPGIRTTVFLKGCNLRCLWCHNPETLNPRPQLQRFLERCIGCGECLHRCPQGAHALVDGQRQFHRERCTGCGRCAETCYAQALVLVGTRKSADEVVREVLRDRPFYASSGGGLTLSGGEPLLQPEFCAVILRLCKDEGIHTALESAGNVGWQALATVLPFTDLLILDLKMMDSRKHRRWTGRPNERILANALRLGREPLRLIVRTPVVPGVNDTAEEIAAIAAFAGQLPNLWYYELLPFHPMAASKYDSLGLACRLREVQSPSRAQMGDLTAVASQYVADARHS